MQVRKHSIISGALTTSKRSTYRAGKRADQWVRIQIVSYRKSQRAGVLAKSYPASAFEKISKDNNLDWITYP